MSSLQSSKSVLGVDNLLAIIGFSFALTLVILLQNTGLTTVSFVSFLISLFIIVGFIQSVGTSISVLGIMALFAALQWLAGPILSYYYHTQDTPYFMVVPEDEYFAYALPGTIAFVGALFLPLLKSRPQENIIEQIRTRIQKSSINGYYLLAIGFLAEFMSQFSPDSLRFFFYIISAFKNVGIFYIIFQSEKIPWLSLLFTYGLLVVTSITSGFFHDLVLWTLFYLMVFAFGRQISLITKIIVIIIGVFGVLVLQSIKSDYRAYTWEGYREYEGTEKIEIFSELAAEQIGNSEEFLEEETMDSNIDRINQGWIIARIMNHVPYLEPYAEGETISEMFRAIFFPRILDTDKAVSGGSEYFERFTGHDLNSASMDLSPLGEGYANFGLWGGVFFMFIYGLFMNLSANGLSRLSDKMPEILLWLPLLYLQTVKAESDLTTGLNHLVKSMVVVLPLLWILRRYDLYRISNPFK